MSDLGDRVIDLLSRHRGVRRAWLDGSRVSGDTTELSDWDIHVEVDDLDGFVTDLPGLLAELHPLGEQWDRLSDRWNYMLLLSGPVKVDIILDDPYEKEPPWTVTAETLPQIEHHFWDWILWLGGKQLRGETDLVQSSLRLMGEHLLGPLGVEAPPHSLAEAIAAYRPARDRAEERLNVRLDRRMEREVVRALGEQGLFPA